MKQFLQNTSKKTQKEDLDELAKDRYLHYAMSVVKGRALPDVRDGLKPVQRRVLYAMYHDLNLTSDKPHRKSAAVVGSVLGNYHPHGDSSTYGTMVKMSQDFSTNHPLVDGYGNFGSIDGDKAAAMRYTEARLESISSEMMEDLKKETVPSSQNYDNTTEEPDVLPARFPLILVNGSIGIAVGMSTSIPPHNLEEVCDATIDLIRNPNRRVSTLVKHHLKGPDFPTGGTIVEGREDITKIYEEGGGSVKIRANWNIEDSGRGRKRIVITELPYNICKEKVVEEIAGHILDDELPQAKDVIDESTDDIRIVIELKRDANPKAVLAFLFKKTPLEDRFNINLTCLKPSDKMDSLVPKRMNLKAILKEYISFRMDVIRKRLKYDLEELKDDIHTLEGYEAIFEDVDRAIELIQSCSERKEARKKLKSSFHLDKEQANSVLSTKIYRLMEGEQESIREELEEKRSKRDKIEDILDDKNKRKELLIKELKRIKKTFGRDRRTVVEEDVSSFQYNDALFIEEEDVKLVISRDGWTSYQKSYTSLDKLRVKDNDSLGWVIDTNTRETALFFTNKGRVYTERINELEDTSGYGNPIQAKFSFDDGEKIISVLTSNEFDEDTNAISVSTQGKGIRFSPQKYKEPSTVRGRKFMKVPEDHETLNVSLLEKEDQLLGVVSENGRINVFPAKDISYMKGAAQGVRSILLEDDDRGIAFKVFNDRQGNIKVETSNGAKRKITSETYESLSRGVKGHWLIQRGGIEKWIRDPIEVK